MEKAVALPTNLGVAILRPISISESIFYYQPFEFRGALMEKSAPMSAETVINPQKLDVSSSIQLVYEIR